MLSDSRYLKKFISIYKPYRLMFSAVLLCALLETGASLLLPLCVRSITKELTGTDAAYVSQQIIRIGLIMFVLVIIKALAAYFYDRNGHIVGAKMERDMRTELFSHIVTLPLGFFDRQKTGTLMSRVTNDLLNISELFHHGPENLILYLLSFIGAVIILFYINLKLALASLILIPAMLLFALLRAKHLKSAYSKSYRNIGEMNALLENSLNGIRVVKDYCAEGAEKKRFQNINDRYCGSRADIYRSEAVYYSVLNHFFSPMISVLVIAAGGFWISAGSLDLADLLIFLLYINYLTAPMPRLTQMIQQFQDGMAGFERFMEVMHIDPEEGDRKAEYKEAAGHIVFQDVSFSYHQDQPKLIKNLSLEIKPGQTAAFIGSSGIGKTTLCSLISRHYPIYSGKILLDGRDIRSMDLHSLRSNIGVVHQDNYLFDGSVLDNLRYAKPDAPWEEIKEAAVSAGAHEFICRLPQAYDTDIGHRGVRLSGGERQRICLARLFLKQPPILILDEATSALDYRTEQSVQGAIKKLAQDHTALIITHRLSAIQEADKIIFLSDEGSVEQGTHQELLERSETYAALYP
ncbi:ABC transporter ATP-binding protein/permease [Treponema sp. OttesenSCG-928-L16]|nr:ABC transporter ATP-binding protein/permease [Treponema sp. OttesenSCG-928-L16]